MLGPRNRKNKHTLHVLNTLANILVSCANAEVVAVGIQLDNKSKKSIITLSTNSSTPEHICHRAMDVWGQLQAISKEQRDLQMKSNRKYDFVKAPGSSKSLRQKTSVNAPIHCECAVAAHFLQETLKGRTPLSFIGMSTPSCFSCWQLLCCIQEAVGVCLFTTGTNEKVCFSWKYPGIELGTSTCRHFIETIPKILFCFGCKVCVVHSVSSGPG